MLSQFSFKNMAKRLRSAAIARLLEQAQELVAVVDDQFCVVYANAFCLNWLETTADQILGKQLVFSSLPVTGPTGDNEFNGICPDPKLFDPDFEPVRGFVYANKLSGWKRKRASFTRLSRTASKPLALIIAAGPDLLQQTQDQNWVADSWHDALARIVSTDPTACDHACTIGASYESERLRRQLDAACLNQANCLIVGPEGSGKEQLARIIIQKLNTTQAPPLSIEGSTADSQLIQDSIQRWVRQQQNSRTMNWLLLLNADRLSAEAQLELWGSRQIPLLEMRIVATSQKDLVELSRHEQFHRGLAMRLSVQVIQTISLAHRKADIPLIAQYLIECQNQRTERQLSGLDANLIELLCEYNWPGEIQEMTQVIGHAHSICNGRQLTESNLPDSFRHRLLAQRFERRPMEPIQLDSFVEDLKKQLVLRAMKDSRNNKTKAAELLGISRGKLIRMLDGWGMLVKSLTADDAETEEQPDFNEAEEPL
jgi:transcriptional regulator with PAS, ATPase and Fis domain